MKRRRDIVAPASASPHGSRPIRAEARATLLASIARGRRWRDEIVAGSADVYLEMAQRYAHVPVKQAVVSASALSLLYPQSGIRGYPRQDFLYALLLEQEGAIRRCLQKGAPALQI